MADYALCPFYEFEKRGTLFCEGTVIKFPKRDDRNEWMHMHCNSWNFKICKFYSEQMKRYRTDTI